MTGGLRKAKKHSMTTIEFSNRRPASFEYGKNTMPEICYSSDASVSQTSKPVTNSDYGRVVQRM